MNVSNYKRAGELPNATDLINPSEVLSAYYNFVPNVDKPEEKVVFGTSGHRGSSLKSAFNETHILAITQSICDFRASKGIAGSLFIGFDTHLLSIPAFKTAIEVLAANNVKVKIDSNVTLAKLETALSGEPSNALKIWTPTPAVSHAILKENSKSGKLQFIDDANVSANANLADGIIITPSHNPPADGGFKYNPPNGGPADTDATKVIAERANELIKNGVDKIRRVDFETAFSQIVESGQTFDFCKSYVDDLKNVVDMAAIKNARVRIGADPLGGAAVDYWKEIAKTYDLDLTVINPSVDPTFRFMTLDWDEKIRMDCSSAFSMKGLVESVGNSGKFDIMTGNDADSDRHGIVVADALAKETAAAGISPSGTYIPGLMNPNHFLAVAIYYLFSGARPLWGMRSDGLQNQSASLACAKNQSASLAGAQSDGAVNLQDCADAKATDVKVGKTLVSSSLIDRVCEGIAKTMCEVPVGFKWFVGGLIDGSFGFGGEESAGASFLKFDGTVWTTDKDGLILCLLASEIFAKTKKTPAQIHRELTEKFGQSFYARIDAPASLEEKDKLSKLSPEQVQANELAGETILAKLTAAPGNNASIGGLKVVTKNAWFAARPSGTENVYKIYAESFISKEHLELVQNEARKVVAEAIK